MAVSRCDAIFSHAADDALRDRRKLRLRATRADHKCLGDGGEAAHIQNKDVASLLLFCKKGDLSCKVVWFDGSLLFG